MLDGYLCGVLIQPRLIDEAEWLPGIFDFDGRAAHRRRPGLARPHHHPHAAATVPCSALCRAGLVRPAVVDQPEDEAAASGDQPLSEAEQLQHDTYAVWCRPHGRCWPGLGFAPCTGALSESWARSTSPASTPALARLFRHLPAETDEEKETRHAGPRAPAQGRGRRRRGAGGLRRRPQRPDACRALPRGHHPARPAQGRPQRPCPAALAASSRPVTASERAAGRRACAASAAG